MSGVQIALGIILLVSAVFLIVAVLMQSGKAHNLSGSIAGGAETFFGKTKGKTIDKMLSKVTTVVSICFALLVIIVYVIQPETTVNTDDWFDENVNLDVTETEAAAGEADADLNADVDLNAEADAEETSAEG